MKGKNLQPRILYPASLLFRLSGEIQGRKRVAYVENGHMDMGVRGGREGRMNWEVRTDIYILPCVKRIASGNLLNSIGSSAGCSVMT